MHDAAQVAFVAAGRLQFQASPLVTLGLGWVVQSAGRAGGDRVTSTGGTDP